MSVKRRIAAARRACSGPNYRSVVIYAPKPVGVAGRAAASAGMPGQANYICFEPMAGITNAMNLAHKGLYKELQSIPPGGSLAGELLGETGRVLSYQLVKLSEAIERMRTRK